jgi:hypothetical protein
MAACTNAKEMGEAEKARNMVCDVKEENAIDYLYFRVVRGHHLQTSSLVEERLSKRLSDDTALQYPFHHENGKRNANIEYEMTRLWVELKSVLDIWRATIRGGVEITADQYNDTVAKCYSKYTKLTPQHDNIPEIKAWLESDIYPGYTKWELLRASALYTAFPDKDTFVFHMAGKELADLKCAPSRTARRVVIGPIYSILRPKAPKVRTEMKDEQVEDSEEEDFTTPLEEVP